MGHCTHIRICAVPAAQCEPVHVRQQPCDPPPGVRVLNESDAARRLRANEAREERNVKGQRWEWRR
jgi:hypothetical protein